MKKLCFLMMLVLISIASLQSPSVYAHTNNSEGYSLIEVNGNNLDYELKLDLTELGHSMQKEMDEKQSFDSKIVQDYINTHINLYADSVKVEGTIKKTEVETINNRQFAVINLNYNIDDTPQKLILDYNMFLDDSDPSHANFATVKLDGKQQEKILTYESRELEIGEATFLQASQQFLLLGLEHIFTGYDHILFVISLLFGAKTIRNIFSLVTAFTIAHSITLALATLEIVQLPGRFVESAIALSIIYVALINIFNSDSKHQPWLAFAFGLIHGFGFAGILSEMRLDGNHLFTSLLSFNIGIEIGQLLIVSLVFPIILWLKKLTFKPIKWVIPGASTAILIFGLVWFIERAF
ncbi:HupE/UreJ family protein [Mesobacillus foraminis]|uniref:Hydrogenase/urease accessory protein HupE n=1 Tax=Mesobacillus foraminis TaxID=279826 RepID=A0A4R2B0B0_9BACI|nr:HupE/UreJ family protein [Mesobacillus foraminis]TCN19751.1 hydrogenase/urease accessory protein HupE [Mesobacillus foraminis]